MELESEHEQIDTVASKKSDIKKTDNGYKLKKVIVKIHVIRNCT